VEWFGLAALGHAVARWSSDILPSLSTAGSTDNTTKLPDLLQQRPTGATPKAVLAICERVAEVQVLLDDHIAGGKHSAGREPRRPSAFVSGVGGVAAAPASDRQGGE
jgi:hypothetical protein